MKRPVTFLRAKRGMTEKEAQRWRQKEELLTEKQQKFVEAYVETKSARKAAKMAYGMQNDAYASNFGALNLKKPHVVSAIDRLMNRAGITDNLLMKKLREGLDATVVSDFKGEVSSTDVPDQNIRHKFWQDAAKMKTWLRELVDTRTMNIDIALEQMPAAEFKKLLATQLKELETQEPEA